MATDSETPEAPDPAANVPEDQPADETPAEETDPRDVRITALEAMVSQLQDALDAAKGQIEILSKGLIKVEGDVDQDQGDEITPPPEPNLLEIMKQMAG